MSAIRVVVTGASGFVGEAVVFRLLRDRKFIPVAAVRGSTRLSGLCSVLPLNLDDIEHFPSLAGVQVVVHAAARVHVMNEVSQDPLLAFRQINVEGTLALARHAAAEKVKRFIFISSIKVNGDSTVANKPFKADDVPAPTDPYGVSKHEAEEGLKQIGQETGMEVVIIRPPLVYGPGVKANFMSLMNWLNKGVPLPFGALANQRSLVAIGNLVDLITVCIDHPRAAQQTFLVSDGKELSTTELLRLLAHSLGKTARLLPLPTWMLKGIAAALGRRAVAQRLCGSLQVDISKTHERLGWVPPVNVDQAMLQTACAYLDKLKK